jgi:hypothetical protein
VIDWSGEAVERPKGLAVAYARTGTDAPELVTHERGWSRAAIGDYLLRLADAGTRALIGLDLSPAFPFADRNAYFPGWSETPSDARALWQLIDNVCAADPHLASTSFVAHPEAGAHFRRQGVPPEIFRYGRGRLRRCEERQIVNKLSPSSCFNLVGAAQVGKSSLTGMRVLHRLGGRIPVWPFDPVPDQGPLIVEIYTTIAAREALDLRGRSKILDPETLDRALASLGSGAHHPLAAYTDHATDAIVTAAWLRRAAARRELWNPPGLDAVAQTEGWTFGVA